MRNVKFIILGLIVLVMALTQIFGQEFTAAGNPIIPLNLPVDEFGGVRNSADPTVGVTQRVSDMTKTLWLFTACDLQASNCPGILYPANRTYCYKTEDLVNWIDCGAVLTEEMFDGWADVEQQLWAPNYKCCNIDGTTTFMLYVPGVDPNGIRRIGIASTTLSPDNEYIARSIFFQGIGTQSDTFGFAYDPGIFSDTGSDADGDWYMSYCTGPYPVGRIAIVRMTDMYSAYDDRRVQMHHTDGTPVSSEWYMEGPEIHKYYINDQLGTIYYLIFALKKDDGLNEYIAYAMATEEEFHDDPWTCWEYQGIIMNPNDYSWTNHAAMVNFKDHMLFFYHKSLISGEESTNARVCVAEFKFNQINGNIPILSQSQPWPGRIDYPMVNMHDETFFQSNMAQPSIYIENTGTYTLANFKAKYYFTVENNKTPVLVDYSTPNCAVFLEHINDTQWAVVLDYAGKTLELGERIPEGSGGDTFRIRYLDWSYFNK